MHKTELLKYFKNYRRAAKYFGITAGAVTQWVDVPPDKVLKLHDDGIITVSKEKDPDQVNRMYKRFFDDACEIFKEIKGKK